MKASKLLTLEQKNSQWAIYNMFKIKYKFPFTFEIFLTKEFKLNK
jgi:hypothetical protein